MAHDAAPPLPTTSTHAYDRRRKRGQRLLARLSRLSSDYPEFKTALRESLQLVTLQINRCPESDRQLILHAIHLGAWTIEELTDETKLTRVEIQRILDELLAAKTIIKKVPQQKPAFRGRPKTLWLPAPNYQPETNSHTPAKINTAAGFIVEAAGDRPRS